MNDACKPQERPSISGMPLPLRTHILYFLCSLPREPSVELSIAHAKHVRELPAELLSAAVASPTLAIPIAEILGTRAAYLTRRAANENLAAWTKALSPYVRALSFHDPEIEYWRMQHSNEQVSNDESPSLSWKLLLMEAEETLRALTSKFVKLQVLDLENVPFELVSPDQKKPLTDLVIRVFSQSANCLRELSVPVHEICVSALENVTLRKLKRMVLHPVGRVETRSAYDKQKGWNTLALSRILYHLGEVSRGFDLVLKKVHGAIMPQNSRRFKLMHAVLYNVCFLTQEKQDARQLFQTVAALQLTNSEDVVGDGHDKVAGFIAMFPNLRCLQWDGMFSAESARLVVGACRELMQVHWKPVNACREHLESEDMGDPDVLPVILATLNGRLRSFEIDCMLFGQHTNALARHCSNLECLSMEIGPKNVHGLKMLLQQCGKIRVLSLPIVKDVSVVEWDLNARVEYANSYQLRMLRRKGWEDLAEAMSFASENLRELRIEYPKEYLYSLADFDEMAMLCAVASVLRCLHSQATRVSFRLPLHYEYNGLVDVAVPLLNTAAECCHNLEQLSLLFQKGPPDGWNCNELRDERLILLRQSRDRLLRNAPKLRELNLGNLMNLI